MSRIPKRPQYEAFNRHSRCFGDHHEQSRSLEDWLDPRRPLMLEVGAGRAEISREFAALHEDWQVIAVDRKSDRLYKAARVLDSEVQNLVFLQANVHDIDNHVDLSHRVDLLWLAFPDPYLASRQAKHRLTHPNFLKQYEMLLKRGATLRFKTDSPELFLYTKIVFDNLSWLEITDEETDLSVDMKKPSDVFTMTSYEQRFRQWDFKIHYLEAHVL